MGEVFQFPRGAAVKERPKSDRPGQKWKSGVIEADCFVQLTLDLMNSPAWRALTDDARRLIDRLLIEHMRNGRVANGRLAVSHSQFAEFGLRRKNVKAAIDVAVALGLVEVTRVGLKVGGDNVPSRYRLTFVSSRVAKGEARRTPGPSDEWRRITTDEEAKAILDAVKAARAEEHAINADKWARRQAELGARKTTANSRRAAA